MEVRAESEQGKGVTGIWRDKSAHTHTHQFVTRTLNPTSGWINRQEKCRRPYTYPYARQFRQAHHKINVWMFLTYIVLTLVSFIISFRNLSLFPEQNAIAFMKEKCEAFRILVDQIWSKQRSDQTDRIKASESFNIFRWKQSNNNKTNLVSLPQKVCSFTSRSGGMFRFLLCAFLYLIFLFFGESFCFYSTLTFKAETMKNKTGKLSVIKNK